MAFEELKINWKDLISKYIFHIYQNQKNKEIKMTCPICGTKAAAFRYVYDMARFSLVSDGGVGRVFIEATCQVCDGISYFFDTAEISNYKAKGPENILIKNEKIEIIFPKIFSSDIDQPSTDMPKEVLDIYNQAAQIIDISPRASLTLARICAEKLVNKLDESKETLDKKIGKLVSEHKIPNTIQEILDATRLIGNSASHDKIGNISFEEQFSDENELKNTVILTLNSINQIVYHAVTIPKENHEFYKQIPENLRKKIDDKRYKKTSTSN